MMENELREKWQAIKKELYALQFISFYYEVPCKLTKDKSQ